MPQFELENFSCLQILRFCCFSAESIQANCQAMCEKSLLSSIITVQWKCLDHSSWLRFLIPYKCTRKGDLEKADGAHAFVWIFYCFHLFQFCLAIIRKQAFLHDRVQIPSCASVTYREGGKKTNTCHSQGKCHYGKKHRVCGSLGQVTFRAP